MRTSTAAAIADSRQPPFLPAALDWAALLAPPRAEGVLADAPADSDATAFAAQYEAHVDFVWTTLRRLGVSGMHLEDAVHEVFVVLWRRRADYDRARPMRPWLFGIAYRVASDVRRRACVVHEVGGVDLETEDERPDPETSLLETEARAEVRRSLDAIRVERRAVFIMHELDDLTIPQIAAALEIPLNTAYSRLRLARAEFERAVRQRRLGSSANAGSVTSLPKRRAA